jgi:hypothetical protein
MAGSAGEITAAATHCDNGHQRDHVIDRHPSYRALSTSSLVCVSQQQ